ncbi:MAG: hypothetical protein ABIR70_21140 [Bryobacteraceae bacterium]
MLCLLVLGSVRAEGLLALKRVYVERLTGGESADQLRDLIIASLHNSKLFVLTEDSERADAFLRGAAEDLIYTDQFQSSDSLTVRATTGAGARSANSSTLANLASRSAGVTVGDNESVNIHERKHEAMASVRLVNKDGDVIWSTTQESGGAKFRGASADVAEKITRQLVEDFARAKAKTDIVRERSGNGDGK